MNKKSNKKNSQKNLLKPIKKLSDSKIEVSKKDLLKSFNGRKFGYKTEKIEINAQHSSANTSQNKKKYFVNVELPPLFKKSFNQQEILNNIDMNNFNSENNIEKKFNSPTKKISPKINLLKHNSNNNNNIIIVPNDDDNENNNLNNFQLDNNEFRKSSSIYKNFLNLNSSGGIDALKKFKSPVTTKKKITLNSLSNFYLDDDKSNNNNKNYLSQSTKINKITSSNHKKRIKKIYLQSNKDENCYLLNNKIRPNKNNSSTQQRYIDIEYLKCLDKINLGNAYSEAGTLEDGTSKTNQDSYIILNNIFNIDYNIFGVLDGHGNNGHLASQFVVKKLSEIFTKEDLYKFKNKKEITTEKIFEKLSTKNCELIKNIINNINKEILSQNEFNVSYSGTTCNLLFQIGKNFICSNTGDSRCLLFKTNILDKKKSEIENFSYDHKPILEKEKKRIDKLGGCVHQTIDYEGEFIGPYRVWVKDEEYPGIAVSRSIGDNVAEKIGVISDPDFIIKTFEPFFQYSVLGSDGLWDVLNGKDLIDLIFPYFENLDGEGAAKKIVDEAVKLWGQKGKLRDDITCIVVFLNLPQSLNKKYKF